MSRPILRRLDPCRRPDLAKRHPVHAATPPRPAGGFVRRTRALMTAGCAMALLFGLLFAMTPPASAAVVNVTSWGNLTSSGGAATCCYNVGYNSGGGPEYRDYFKFNLSSITPGTTIYGATLSIKEPAYSSATSSVTFNVGSYGSNVGYLTSGNGADVITAWTALGSGTLWGTGIDTSANNGGYLDIVLNAAALAAIVSAEGSSTFIIGGYTSGLPTNAANSIFQYSGSQGAVHLTLDTVPEPASLTLLGAGLVGLGLRRRLRFGTR